MSTIQTIGQIAVPVQNLERAIAFYRDILQLPLLFTASSLAFFDCDGVRLLLSEPEPEFTGCSSVLYFKTANIHRTYESLQARMQFTDEPHVVAKIGNVETWMVFFKDTEGNTHAFMSEVTV